VVDAAVLGATGERSGTESGVEVAPPAFDAGSQFTLCFAGNLWIARTLPSAPRACGLLRYAHAFRC
jgi:hypothetical protein